MTNRPDSDQFDVGDAGAGDSTPPALGVLLVHGIGYQKRGETLYWAGDPFIEWLKSWCTEAPNWPRKEKSEEPSVYLTGTRLVRPLPSERDEPPSMRLWFRRGAKPSQQDLNWVVAELYWAEEFAPPSFPEMLALGLGIAPLLLERTGLKIAREDIRYVKGKAGCYLSLKGVESCVLSS